MSAAAAIAGAGGVGAVIAFAWWLVAKLLGYVDRLERSREAYADARATIHERAAQISILQENNGKLERRVAELEERRRRASDRLHEARKAAKDADSNALDSALLDGLQDLEALRTP